MTRLAIAIGIAVGVGVGAGVGGCSKEKKAEGVSLLPGAPPVPAELAARIRAAGGGHRYTNRLIFEASPYLQQHAHNPVDWRPWGEEALAEARRLGRPILLSIGYSTCHWCHVMAEESFEDVEIATFLNQHYIAIKVDREERPDLDGVYQRALEAMGQPGGWPLTVWLTPEGEPFFGGTYFPARDGDRSGAVGFLTALRRGHELWQESRDEVVGAADQVKERMVDLVTSQSTPGAVSGLGDATIERAIEQIRKHYDAENGGILVPGEQSKFPGALPVGLLLRHAARTGRAEGREMVLHTLERMAAGGIRDHIGGGFHRYSTDPRWLVPHFEKMLYDNALLATAYLEAYRATGRDDFAEVARETLAFMEAELGAKEGGFCAALDADSAIGGKRIEGAYYTWTPAELEAAVGAEAAPLLAAWFGVSEAGNVEGRSVVAIARPLAEAAAAAGVDEARAREFVAAGREAMRAARQKRAKPHRDNKIVAGWNALAISALVEAALVLDRGDPRSHYLARARQAAEFLLERMVREDGSLLRVWSGGAAGAPGVLADYAYAVAALLDLFEATGEVRWLERARALDRVMARDFEAPDGGFFMTPKGGEELLVRVKPVHDDALPSGNAVAAMNLIRLHRLTGEESYRKRVERLLSAFAGVLTSSPITAPGLLLVLEALRHPGPEIVLVAPSARGELAPFFEVLGGRHVPGHLLVPVVAAEVEGLAAEVPLLEGKLAIGGEPTAFVCRARVCRLPSRDPAAFASELSRAMRAP